MCAVVVIFFVLTVVLTICVILDITSSLKRVVAFVEKLETGDMTCRVRGCTTSGRYVRILDFRHFERHMMFSQSDRKTYKKAISDGVNVSVVLDVGCGNT